MKTKVAIVSCKEYDRSLVLSSVEKCIELCGGMESIIKKGDDVLLKPNLLTAKPPEKAVTTHPEMLFALGSILKRHTDKIRIGDSPAFGTCAHVIKKNGMEKIVQELGLSITEFQKSVSFKLPEGLFNLELSKDCLEAPKLINMPKLKTHSQMLMTLAVKNLFGCIVGTRKADWHFRSGVDYLSFARLLVEICLALKPCFNLIDGITGMQGDGPNNGDPREIGVIVGGENPFAVDFVVCKIVGIDPEELFTMQIARKMGIFGTREEEIEILGETIENVQIKDFIRPKNHPLLFGPSFLQGFLRKTFTARPVIQPKTCQMCMACKKICPAQAIQQEKDALKISYQHCIRCYCCQEICPHKAIETQQSLILRIMKRLVDETKVF